MPGEQWGGDTACSDWLGSREAECPTHEHSMRGVFPLMEKALESMCPRPGASFSLGHVSLDQGNSQLHGSPLPTSRALLKGILLGPRFLSLS